ncbi:MAG TPA: hypothetical protein VFA81_10700 [Burkholderiales bacterium]|nr:hypothetical protein [Burkholderiales bacterium]
MAFSVLFALVLLAWLLPSLWMRLSRLTLLDFFLLAIAMFFGAYTILDTMAAEQPNFEPVAVASVFVIVSGATLILWWFARRPSQFLQETSLARMRADWIGASRWPIIGLVGLAVVYRIITATMYAELGPEELSGNERDLPYWFTSLGMIVNVSVFPAALCCWGKARATQGPRRLYWFALAGLCALVIMGMGRRAIFALLVITGWDLLTQFRARRRLWLPLLLLIMFVPMMLMISNVYQAYRFATVRGVPMENMAEMLEEKSLLESAADVNETISNIEQRQAMWRFNYSIVDADLRGMGSPQWGRILIGGLQNLVPSAIYPDKVIFDTEAETQAAFGLERVDQSENIFTSTYADFGFLSIVIAPLFILLIVWACAHGERRLRDPFLRALLLGAALFLALNLEQSYMTPFGFARDFAFVAAGYVALRAFFRVARSIVRLAIQ